MEMDKFERLKGFLNIIDSIEKKLLEETLMSPLKQKLVKEHCEKTRELFSNAAWIDSPTDEDREWFKNTIESLLEEIAYLRELK
jgi:hypothetical protein